MKTFSKGLLAAAIMAGSTSVAHATVIGFDDSGLGGDNVFEFDEISISDVDGTSFITQTDTNNDGTLIGDTFTEIGLTGSIRFNLDGSPLTDATTGLVTEYEIIFDVTLSGDATATPINLDADPDFELILLSAFFDPSSTIDLYYDTDLATGIGGGAIKIGEFTDASGGCSGHGKHRHRFRNRRL